MRRGLLAVMLAVVLVAASPVASAAESATARAWSRGLCTGLDDWAASIEKATATLPTAASAPGYPAASSAKVVSALTKAEKATSRLVAKLRNLSAPKVTDGARVQKTVVDGILAVRTALRDQRATLERTKLSSAADLANAVERAGAALSAAIGEIAASFEQAVILGDAALNRALAGERACQELVTG